MRFSKFFGYVLLFSFFINCGQDEKRNHLSIKIDAIIQENDSIQTFYTTNSSIDFNETQSFWTHVKGSKKNQTLSFHFPDSVKPKQVRMDFGRNIKQRDIVLNEINFFYLDKNFSAKGEEIYWIFRVNDANTLIDKLTGKLKRKDTTETVGPSLYPEGDKLFKKLNELYSKN